MSGDVLDCAADAKMLKRPFPGTAIKARESDRAERM